MEARRGPRGNNGSGGDGRVCGGGNSSDAGVEPSDIAADACAAAGTEEQVTKARSGGRRRSCNRCSSKKERCDGQEPCQRCVRSRLECLYATCRTLGRPRNSVPTSKGRSSSASRGKSDRSGVTPPVRRAAGAGASAALARDVFAGAGAAMGVDETVVYVVGKYAAASAVEPPTNAAGSRSTGGAVTIGSTVADAASVTKSSSLKRLSFSASPATGLKGMVENVYLNWFVEDFASFFRVLDDATIRLGLINLMTDKVDAVRLASAGRSRPPPSKKRSAKAAAPRPRSMAGSFKAMNPGGWRKAKSETLTEDLYAINSSIFSAMALGALLAGQTPSRVHQYVEVAEASLRICGLEVEMSPVPNERVAAAHLLLAFASNVAGQDQYHFHIMLTRQCYDECVRCGLYTPPPICETLRYRAIIDALGKPLDAGVVPAPRVDDVPGGMGSGEIVATSAGDDRIIKTGEKRSRGRKHSRGGRIRRRNGRADADALPTRPALNRKGSAAATAVTAVKSSDSKTQATVVGGARGAVDDRIPSGMEAARERRRRRQAEPLLMICDIMTLLSKVPWSTEEDALWTRKELREMRSLIVAEKELLEERRSARGGRPASTSNALGDYTLNSAMVGLHCALNEFAELLALGRDLARCISACPGLSRYNVHAYHVALAILRTFEKREEFNNLVKEVPRELRFATPSGRSISFDAEGEEMCAMPVCVRHTRLIQDLGMSHRRESSPAPAEPSAALTEVEDPTAGAARSEQPKLPPLVGTTLTPAPHAQSDEDQYELLPDSLSSVERDRLDSSSWRPVYGSEWCEKSALEGAGAIAAEAQDEWLWARPCSSPSPSWAPPPLPGDGLGSVLPIASAVGDSAAADLGHPSATCSVGEGEEGERGRRLPPESLALPSFAQVGSAGGSGVGGEVAATRSSAGEVCGVPSVLATSREDHLLSPPPPQQQQPRRECVEVDVGQGSNPTGEGCGFIGDAREPWRERRDGEKGRRDSYGDSGGGNSDIDSGRHIPSRGDGDFVSNSLVRQAISRAGWTANASGLDGSSNEALTTQMNLRSGGARSPTLASAQQAAASSKQAPQAPLIGGGVLTNRLWGSGMLLLEAKDKGNVSSTDTARGGRSSWPWSQTHSGAHDATKNSSPTRPLIASRFLVPGGNARDVVREAASEVAAAAVPALPPSITTWQNAREETRAGPGSPELSADAATLSRSLNQVGGEGGERCRGGAGPENQADVGERRSVGSGGAVEVAVGRNEDEDDILSLWKIMGDGDASE